MANVTTYYLEMSSPASLKSKDDPKGLVVSECSTKQFEFNKFLYRFIGGKWLWTDKLSWNDQQWKDYVEKDTLRTFVAYSGGSIAGYFELLRESDEVEIIYFGLAEPFIGKGHGGYLLTEAIKAAWKWENVKRVWVHTCSLDHPSALQNYLSRGMKIYKTETADVSFSSGSLRRNN
jgi:GNAT superfamily N-acetyltransferase